MRQLRCPTVARRDSSRVRPSRLAIRRAFTQQRTSSYDPRWGGFQYPGACSPSCGASDTARGVQYGPMPSYISVLDLFSVGIGPSSSHTVGPMRAATAFVASLADEGVLPHVGRVTVKLCGSLGATGLGHGTPDAVLAGLRGHAPETCDPAAIPGGVAALGDGCTVELDEIHAVSGSQEITMTSDDIMLAPLTRMPGHPNGMRFTAFATVDEPSTPTILSEKDYYSVGGGFVVAAEDLAAVDASGAARGADPTHRPPVPGADISDVVPHPFASADELLVLCEATGMSIAEIAWENECSLRPAAEVISGLDAIWRVMSECVDAGLARVGVLPGSLKVKRRARALGISSPSWRRVGRTRPSSGCRPSPWPSTRRTPTAVASSPPPRTELPG